MTMSDNAPTTDATPSEYMRVTDDTFENLLAAERAVLVIGKSDCGYCYQYEKDIAELVDTPAYAGIVFGKLVLDERGSTQIKRANPWIADLEELPYTVLYRDGNPVSAFAASKASYLKEQLQETFLGPM